MTWFDSILEVPKRRRLAFAGVLVLLLLLLLLPFKLTIVPRWRLHVSDDAGALVRDVRVTEHWQHYLVEAEGHEEVLRTDEAGQVDFPERTIRVGLGSMLLKRMAALIPRRDKTKIEPYASIVVWGSPDYETTVAVYEPEAQLQSQIVVHRLR